MIQAHQRAALYDLLNTFFWTLLCLAPVGYYAYLYTPLTWLWIIIPAFFIPYLLPIYTISTSRKFYERLGIHALLTYVQHGRWINRLIRKHHPDYKIVYNKATIRKKIHETYMFERFHNGLLMVFTILFIHALKAHWQWAIAILLCNIGYNIYPILMQQYVRLRLGGWPAAFSKPSSFINPGE